VASSDFTEDLRIGPEIIKSAVDSIALAQHDSASCWPTLEGFDAAERIRAADMPSLERFILARLATLGSGGARRLREI
jgi:isoleucyl-tRNA synthetase